VTFIKKQSFFLYYLHPLRTPPNNMAIHISPIKFIGSYFTLKAFLKWRTQGLLVPMQTVLLLSTLAPSLIHTHTHTHTHTRTQSSTI